MSYTLRGRIDRGCSRRSRRCRRLPARPDAAHAGGRSRSGRDGRRRHRARRGALRPRVRLPAGLGRASFGGARARRSWSCWPEPSASWRRSGRLLCSSPPRGCSPRCSGTPSSRGCGSRIRRTAGSSDGRDRRGASAFAILLAASSVAYATRPPTVRLPAGVVNGPLVITREETLVGRPGTVVTGGIVVHASGVVIRNLTVVGGEYGIDVERARRVRLDGVRVFGQKLDGIHVRFSQVMIRDCTVAVSGAVCAGNRHLVLRLPGHGRGRGM